MRFSTRVAVAGLSFCTLAAIGSGASAQMAVPATPTPAVQTSSILSVALPPQGRLRFDMDARDEDLLGVVKSLLRGFNTKSLKPLLPSKATDAKAAAPLNAEMTAMIQL